MEPGVEIAPAKNGQPTLRVGSRAWHSSYNPEAEARQWAASQKLTKPIILLIGDGLGWATDALLKNHPEHLVATVGRVPLETSGTFLKPRWHWSPTSSESLKSWFRQFTNGLSAEKIQVLIWPGARACEPENLKLWTLTFSGILREEEANLATFEGMGRAWLFNTIKRSINSSHLYRITSTQGTAVLAASGPSLETFLKVAGQSLDDVFLFALASAAPALEARGFQPGAIFSTDGGYWAHRLQTRSTAPRISPLASVVETAKAQWFPFTQGYHYEKFLFRDTVLPDIPSKGTVSFSAWDFLEKTWNGPIALAGLDLCSINGRNHTSPHPIDDYHLYHRLKTPETHRISEDIQRSSHTLGKGFKQQSAMKLYAEALSNRKTTRTVRVEPSVVQLSNVQEIPAGNFPRWLNQTQGPQMRTEEVHLETPLLKRIWEWKKEVESLLNKEIFHDPLIQEVMEHLIPRKRAQILQGCMENKGRDLDIDSIKEEFLKKWNALWRSFLR